MGYSYRFTSHEGIDHDTLDNFGYDWEKIGNPEIRPKYPLKIYLPRTTEDVVAIIKEANTLGEKLTVRSKGHSSNDLVLRERGAILSTALLNRVIDVDTGRMLATAQSGCLAHDIEEILNPKGLGFPVLGDHNDITIGGYTSVGGIGPSSHRYGMFVDILEKLEYVNWDGEVRVCSRTENRDEFYRVACGLGQYGVITSLTAPIIHVDKLNTILRNRRTVTMNLNKFLDVSGRGMGQPGEARMIRGAWNDLGRFKIGHFSPYFDTTQSWLAAFRNKAVYGYLHALGWWAGRLPAWLDKIVKALGIVGLLAPPRYASIKNVEYFSDRIVDSTVGDPTRWLIFLVPMEKYRDMFLDAYNLALDYRAQHGCFTFVSMYVKAFRSEYLSKGDPDKLYCEMNLYLGIGKSGLSDESLAEMVDKLDDIAIRHNSFRYMHTKTVKDEKRRALIDPNAMYAGRTTTAAAN